ncbi:MAG TPA: zinc metallopeptidase [Fimbriimonadaceae bacterium]|nr:zinc metallopeptidase [Fimbriimonadaceae bacterium]
MIFDPMYFVFALPGLAFALWAQWKVKSTFARYAQEPTSRGVNGVDAAQYLMNHTGVRVGVENIPGELTDHYDPRSKVIRLSESSVQNSVASVAVVAHELGHAEQDAQNYMPLKLRGAIVPTVQVSSWVGPMIFIGGMMLNNPTLAIVGILAFGAAALFALVTLPVEFNASSRALANLQSSNLLTANEMVGAKKVLDAAALTYVAAAAQSILTLLYYVMIFTRSRE